MVWAMDAVNFERIYDGLQFHAFFAHAFGRKQWRERSRNYLQALLVQAGERRNAEVRVRGRLGTGTAALSHRGPLGR